MTPKDSRKENRSAVVAFRRFAAVALTVIMMTSVAVAGVGSVSGVAAAQDDCQIQEQDFEENGDPAITNNQTQIQNGSNNTQDITSQSLVFSPTQDPQSQTNTEDSCQEQYQETSLFQLVTQFQDDETEDSRQIGSMDGEVDIDQRQDQNDVADSNQTQSQVNDDFE